MRLGALLTLLNSGLDSASESVPQTPVRSDGSAKLTLSPSEWRKRLTPDQFHVLRERGSNRGFRALPLRGETVHEYCCVGCANELFALGDILPDALRDALPDPRGPLRFASPIVEDAVYESLDSRYGLLRIAISCARCDGHLGYVKLDPTTVSGKLYLVESIAMTSRIQN